MSRFTLENGEILDYGLPMTNNQILDALNEIADLEESIQDIFADQQHLNISRMRLLEKIGKYTQEATNESD